MNYPSGTRVRYIGASNQYKGMRGVVVGPYMRGTVVVKMDDDIHLLTLTNCITELTPAEMAAPTFHAGQEVRVRDAPGNAWSGKLGIVVGGFWNLDTKTHERQGEACRVNIGGSLYVLDVKDLEDARHWAETMVNSADGLYVRNRKGKLMEVFACSNCERYGFERPDGTQALHSLKKDDIIENLLSGAWKVVTEAEFDAAMPTRTTEDRLKYGSALHEAVLGRLDSIEAGEPVKLGEQRERRFAVVGHAFTNHTPEDIEQIRGMVIGNALVMDHQGNVNALEIARAANAYRVASMAADAAHGVTKHKRHELNEATEAERAANSASQEALSRLQRVILGVPETREETPANGSASAA